MNYLHAFPGSSSKFDAFVFNRCVVTRTRRPAAVPNRGCARGWLRCCVTRVRVDALRIVHVQPAATRAPPLLREPRLGRERLRPCPEVRPRVFTRCWHVCRRLRFVRVKGLVLRATTHNLSLACGMHGLLWRWTAPSLTGGMWEALSPRSFCSVSQCMRWAHPKGAGAACEAVLRVRLLSSHRCSKRAHWVQAAALANIPAPAPSSHVERPLALARWVPVA